MWAFLRIFKITTKINLNNFKDLHQDDRSIGAYSTEDDGVYDKNTLVTRHHELDPDNNYERYKSEIKTTKNISETFHK